MALKLLVCRIERNARDDGFIQRNPQCLKRCVFDKAMKNLTLDQVIYFDWAGARETVDCFEAF